MKRYDIIKLAAEHGASIFYEENPDDNIITLDAKGLEALFHAAQKLEREECAKFFSDNDTVMFWGSQAAKHIRNKSNHETK